MFDNGKTENECCAVGCCVYEFFRLFEVASMDVATFDVATFDVVSLEFFVVVVFSVSSEASPSAMLTSEKEIN